MFASFGYAVAHQSFEDGLATYINIEVIHEGTERPDEIVIVGGHYDSVEGTPGADDNASGTAAVLELARLLREETFPRTIRFVAFANEEPPFFGTGRMGSAHYAARSADLHENIVAMISLETVGYFQDNPESQGYPAPFNFFYPDVGNFIGFVGNLPSRGLVRRSLATFRDAVQFPSEGVAAPEQIPGVWWSDHSPFWTHGFKAIMITDTAPFRNPHYHQSTDTPDRLDYDRMARVVTGVAAVVRQLARDD
jgi:Zn-dependent M28 family amino/carboxypeptidase